MIDLLKKNALKIAIGLGALLALTGIAILIGRRVGTPDQHDPARFGTVQVRLGPGWPASERARLATELARLHRLGPDFRWAPATPETPPGWVPDGRKLFTVVVNRGDWGPTSCNLYGAGYYDTLRRTVHIDPVCAPGEMLESAFGHEIGHALGMMHVCRSAGETRDHECSPVGFDRLALMNPTAGVELGFMTGTPIADLGPPALDPTFKDLEEFLRARNQPAPERPHRGGCSASP